MKINALKPYLVVIGLMVVTSFLLAHTVDVDMSNEAGIQVYLPDQVREWVGREIRYCQNPEHRQTYFVDELENADICPDCDAELYMMSIEERRILPADTIILKKQYGHPSGDRVTSSIVLSGADRSSIHRPQVCLVGQGQEIEREWTHSVPLEGRDDLRVVVLDMLRRWTGPDGESHEHRFYYAYWFVGKGRETHSHLMRMALMAYDRIFHNVSHRWAYISVSGMREAGNRAHADQINEFIQTIYPAMALRDDMRHEL